MTDDVGTNSISGQVSHCGQPMKIIRRLSSWKGNDQYEEISLRCEACPTTAELKVVEPVGAPAPA